MKFQGREIVYSKGIMFLLLLLLIVGCEEKDKSPITLTTNNNKITMINNDVKFVLEKKLLVPDISYHGKSIVDNKLSNISLNQLYVNGTVVQNFEIVDSAPKLETINDMHGKGKRLELTAVGSLPKGINIKQNLKIDMYEKYPNLVILNVSYTNMGASKTITIDSVFTGSFLLNSSLTNKSAEPYSFYSFQGAAYEWGHTYAKVPITKDFYQKNFMGLYTRYRESVGMENEGGGINVVDVWNAETGVALNHLAMHDLFVSFPTHAREDGRVSISMLEEPDSDLGQKVSFAPGETYSVQAPVGIVVHTGDFYTPLEIYKELLIDQGLAIRTTSPKWMFEGYWKTWGWEADFTLEQIYNRIPELLSLGIKQVMIDDGWFTHLGDWEPVKSKYPNGDADVKASVKKMKELGAERVYLWWNPMAAALDSKVAKEHPDWLIMAKDGKLATNYTAMLCPAYKPVQDYLRGKVKTFIKDWGYDGLYHDYGMNSAAPVCYNPAHHHAKPTDSFEALPDMWRIFSEEAEKYNPEPFFENCICSRPHSLFKNPYVNLTGASDQQNVYQLRDRIKVEKATHGPHWAYNAYVNQHTGMHREQTLEEFDTYWASVVGIGAIPTSFYGDPPPEVFAYYKKWYKIYFREMFSDGEYLNLYDIAYQKPEMHVVNKNGVIYYGIFADNFNGEVELRGLSSSQYEVINYVDNVTLGKVEGPNAKLNIEFKNYLLIKCVPNK